MVLPTIIKNQMQETRHLQPRSRIHSAPKRFPTFGQARTNSDGISSSLKLSTLRLNTANGELSDALVLVNNQNH